RRGAIAIKPFIMSTQVPYPPASPPASHGGNLDPNEVRLRQQPATSPFPAYPAPGTSMPSSESSSHGGNMDPNATRLRLADMQQTSGSSEQVSLVTYPDPISLW
ncbi:MAG: hypothetical protein Q9196_002602, partial [Gyalolechia fulgens]